MSEGFVNRVVLCYIFTVEKFSLLYPQSTVLYYFRYVLNCRKMPTKKGKCFRCVGIKVREKVKERQTKEEGNLIVSLLGVSTC